MKQYENEARERWGKMYTADERFKKNIDTYGEGTARFVSSAIDAFCKGRGEQ